MNEIPEVVIVGRPNTGKSSLFNAFSGKRISIVHSDKGVTRDRVSTLIHYHKRTFRLSDTGGLVFYLGEKPKPEINSKGIFDQVMKGLEKAKLVLFVVDIRDGVTVLDKEISRFLKKSAKKTILIANKSDNDEMDKLLANFAELGWKDIFAVSCTHRRGIGDLLAFISENAGTEEAPCVEPVLKIVVAGRPNVGKSSLINYLLRDQRVLVSEEPGTTRDSVDIEFELKSGEEKLPAILIDTAGLRQKRRADSAVEIFSIMRTENAIKRANIVLFMIDSGTGKGTSQDKKVASIITENHKACMIIANKWDLNKEQIKKRNLMDEIRFSMPFLDYAPIIVCSAMTGDGVSKICDEIIKIRKRMHSHISTSELNRIIGEAIESYKPSISGNRFFKVYYGTVKSCNPPGIILFANYPESCPKNYISYLRNFISSKVDIIGLPLVIEIRKK